MQQSLLLGCGHSRLKKVFMSDSPGWTGKLVTLDMNPNCGADVVFDMSSMTGVGPDFILKPQLPFIDFEFDELAAYDVLEHFGSQGNWRAWFDFMAECHRILKPGGLFGIIVPIGADALADPGHTRFFHENHFGFLNQQFYADNMAKGTQFTDYRWYWTLNYDIMFMQRQGEPAHHLSVMLRKS